MTGALEKSVVTENIVKFVVIGLFCCACLCPTITTKRMCRDTKPTHQLNPPCRNKKIVLQPESPHYPDPCRDTKVSVAIQSEPTLSRQRVLCRDREPKEACSYRPCQACLRMRALPIAHTTPFLSRHCCSVVTQNLKWEVAHPI